MKKVLLAAGAFSALAIALPAAAQSYRGDPIHQQFERLEHRIERGAQSGRLTRNEHRALRYEFSQLVRLDSQYRRDGLSRWEYADLDRRVNALQARLRWERRDGDRYDDRYGRHDDRYDDRYGRRDDRRGYR
jgi:hypothetical protein